MTGPHVWNVIQAARESYGDDTGAFLCFMGVRLIAMRRVLRDDGSLYLHCDPTASHYLKQLLDAIFGRKNFRNEIVWCYKSGGASKRRFARKHDIILLYARDEKRASFNPLKVKSYGDTGGGQGGPSNTTATGSVPIPSLTRVIGGRFPCSQQHMVNASATRRRSRWASTSA